MFIRWWAEFQNRPKVTLFSLLSNLRREELFCAQVTSVAQEGNFYPKAAELGTAGRAVGPSMDDTESQSRDKVTQRETHGRDTKTQNGSPKLPNPQLGENAESGVCPRQGKVRSEVEAGKCPWWAEPILVGGVCLWRGPSRVCPWWAGLVCVEWGGSPDCGGGACLQRAGPPNLCCQASCPELLTRNHRRGPL